MCYMRSMQNVVARAVLDTSSGRNPLACNWRTSQTYQPAHPNLHEIWLEGIDSAVWLAGLQVKCCDGRAPSSGDVVVGRTGLKLDGLQVGGAFFLPACACSQGASEDSGKARWWGGSYDL